MSKFKFDIFLSYKRGKSESKENGYKYLGISVARMLKLSLGKEGYDVYFDCDTEDKGKSSDKAKQNADDKKALETLVAMGKSRLVLLLLTGYSFDNENGKMVAKGVFGEELKKIKELWSANKNNVSSSKTRILAINIDATFDEGKDYGEEYNWVKEVLDNSYISPLTPEDAHDFRTNQFFNNDFRDLMNKIKGRGKGELNIRPSRPSYCRMKKLLIWMVIALFAALGGLAFFVYNCCEIKNDKIRIEEENNKLRNIPDGYGEGVVHEYTKGKGVKYEYIDYEHMANPSIDLLKNSFWCDSSLDHTGSCPIVYTTKKVKNASAFIDSLRSYHDDPVCLLEFEIGSVDLTVYVCNKTQKKWEIKKTNDLFDDVLRSKGLFAGKPKYNYFVMAGVDGTGEWYLDTLYYYYKNSSRRKGTTLSIDEFKKRVFDTEFHPVNGGSGKSLEVNLKDHIVLVLENATVEKDKEFLKFVSDSIKMDQKLNMYAYTLVTIKDKNYGSAHREIEFLSNQNAFFDQLVDTNYKELENSERSNKVIYRKSKWVK